MPAEIPVACVHDCAQLSLTVTRSITTGCVGCSLSVAERLDPLHGVVPIRHLADDGVLGGKAGVFGGDHEELATARSRRLCLRLRHRDHTLRVRGVGRRRVDGRVARPAAALPCRVAALDDEVRHDAMEGRVVVEAGAGERHERRGRVRRQLLVERDLEVAAVGLEDEHVRLRLVERRPRASWRRRRPSPPALRRPRSLPPSTRRRRCRRRSPRGQARPGRGLQRARARS